MIGRGSDVLREFLERFRRPAAVPPPVSDELAAELAPLFQALDALDREAETLRNAAGQLDRDREDATAAAISELLAAAGERAHQERDAARLIRRSRYERAVVVGAVALLAADAARAAAALAVAWAPDRDSREAFDALA